MDEPTRRRIRHLNRSRIHAEHRAQDALDDPDRVWANQRRVLRAENRNLQHKAGQQCHRAWQACQALEWLAKGENLDPFFYAELPDTTREAVRTIQKRLEVD